LVAVKTKKIDKSVGVLAFSQQLIGDAMKVAFGDLSHSPSSFEDL